MISKVYAFLCKVDKVASEYLEDLKARSFERAHRDGSSLLHREEDGGILGQLIREDLLKAGFEQEVTVSEVLRELGSFLESWVPVTAIVRDALPHLIALRQILLPLSGGYFSERDRLTAVLGTLALDFKNGHEVLLLGVDELKALAGKLGHRG